MVKPIYRNRITEDPILSLITKENNLSITSIDTGSFQKELKYKNVEVSNKYREKFKTLLLHPSVKLMSH